MQQGKSIVLAKIKARPSDFRIINPVKP